MANLTLNYDLTDSDLAWDLQSNPGFFANVLAEYVGETEEPSWIDVANAVPPRDRPEVKDFLNIVFMQLEALDEEED